MKRFAADFSRIHKVLKIHCRAVEPAMLQLADA
jgi:hypothetical protein